MFFTRSSYNSIIRAALLAGGESFMEWYLPLRFTEYAAKFGYDINKFRWWKARELGLVQDAIRIVGKGDPWAFIKQGANGAVASIPTKTGGGRSSQSEAFKFYRWSGNEVKRAIRSGYIRPIKTQIDWMYRKLRRETKEDIRRVVDEIYEDNNYPLVLTGDLRRDVLSRSYAKARVTSSKIALDIVMPKPHALRAQEQKVMLSLTEREVRAVDKSMSRTFDRIMDQATSKTFRSGKRKGQTVKRISPAVRALGRGKRFRRPQAATPRS